MSRRRFALGALVMAAALGVSPAAASPRVTLAMESATFHEVIRKLQELTSFTFTSADGAGHRAFQDPPNARRIRVEWKDMPLGLVLRDLCGRFGQNVVSNGDNGFWFQPGALAKRKEVLSGGIAFSLGAIQQLDQTAVVPGGAAPRFQRTLHLSLICRALDGEGDVISGLKRMVLVDEGGKSHQPTAVLPAQDWAALPDERSRPITVHWQGEHARRLQRIEGELNAYSRLDEHRWTVPLEGSSPPVAPLEKELGPVSARIGVLRVAGRSVQTEIRLEWPDDADVTVRGPAAVRVFVKLDNGKYQRLHGAVKSGEVPSGAAESRTLSMELLGQCESSPVALEVRVPVRAGPMRAIPFRLENILLPFGQPLTLRTEPLGEKVPALPGRSDGLAETPPALADLPGGTLVAEVPVAARKSHLAATLSLSRKMEDGRWSAFRWVRVPVESETVRLEGLRPGIYRVRLRCDLPGEPRGANFQAVDRTEEVRIELRGLTRVLWKATG